MHLFLAEPTVFSPAPRMVTDSGDVGKAFLCITSLYSVDMRGAFMVAALGSSHMISLSEDEEPVRWKNFPTATTVTPRMVPWQPHASVTPLHAAITLFVESYIECHS